jgi:hypothetical protein
MMYAIGFGACLSVIYISFAALSWIVAQPQPVTGENLSQKIMEWIRPTMLSTRDVSPDNPDDLFSIEATLPNRRTILINRRKDEPDLLFIHSYISVSNEHKEILAKMSARERERWAEGLDSALSIRDQQYVFDLPNRISVGDMIAIQNITEDAFFHRFTGVQNAITIIVSKFRELKYVK